VDDDPDIRDWMELMLSSRGFEVAMVSGGRMALQIVEKLRPDLILLDVTMPDMDGYEVCARLQANKQTAYIPVIFVTAHAQESDKLRALQAGAADYLVKPLEEKSFTRTVDLHLATGKRWNEITVPPGRTPTGETKVEASGPPRWNSKLRPSEFTRFKEYLGGKANLPPDVRASIARLTAPELFTQGGTFRLTEKQIVESMAKFLSLPCITQIDPSALKLGVLPTPFCKSNSIVPVTYNGDGNAFLLSNPFDWEVQEAVQRVLGRNGTPTLVLTEPARIQKLLSPQSGRSGDSMSVLEAKLKEEYVPVQTMEELRENNANEDSAPIIQLVASLIETAYAQGASDIHIEPTEEDVVVRYRVDGDLAIVNRFKPARLINPIVARLKIMAGMDITEHRLPLDGRIIFKKFSSIQSDFDLRVATAPMNFGEKVVMRILDKQKSVLPLSELGFSPRNLEIYREKSTAPYGMILNVGPTGSGKSMTLYAALNEVKNPSINIQTAEDPIEYTLPGINQLQVHKDIGLDFKRALRSFLRLDPDVILVGEIRDRETADIAIEAALTGHLLLSTLHTNDATSTVTRFIEMGVEPYLVSSSLLVVCAQRLLRRLCKECKEPYTPDALQRQFVGVEGNAPLTLYRAKGCEKCNKTGYKGRIGIHEVMAPDDNFRAAVNEKGITSEALKRVAVDKMGMTTLFWDAMEKVRQGLCSVSDALANVRQDEFDSRPKWMKEGSGVPGTSKGTRRREKPNPDSSPPPVQS
jgi:type IV pilus assembly protein PilB